MRVKSLEVALGIDPSTKSTGLTLFRGGIPHTLQIAPTAKTLLEKYDEIRTRYCEWISQWVVTSGLCIIETQFRNVPLVGLHAILSLEAFASNFHVQSIHPKLLKHFAIGKAHGEKDEVRLAVFKRWNFEDPSNDVVDSYVMAHMARCRVDGDGYTAYQREIVERAYNKKSPKR